VVSVLGGDGMGSRGCSAWQECNNLHFMSITCDIREQRVAVLCA
jgi:hypothetical protein